MSEYTDLIREARELPRADPGDVIDSLVERLADALEASVARAAELREYAQKVLDGAGSGDFGGGEGSGGWADSGHLGFGGDAGWSPPVTPEATSITVTAQQWADAILDAQHHAWREGAKARKEYDNLRASSHIYDDEPAPTNPYPEGGKP